MNQAPSILVTGASGVVGAALVQELAPLRPRLGLRSAAKIDAARAEGHDAAYLDFGDPTSLASATRGVDVVFLLSPTGPAQLSNELALVRAAVDAGVRKIVKLSVWAAETRAFAFARIHREVEERIEASGVSYTFLRANGFMQNFVTHMAGAIRNGVIAQPAADARIGHVDVRDVARVAKVALTSSALDGKAPALSGPHAFGYAEAANILERVLERPVRYVPLSDEAARAAMVSGHMPPAQAEQLIELFQYYRTSGAAAVTGEVLAITRVAPTDFETFVRQHAAALR